MTDKHTPGPWRVECHHGAGKIISAGTNSYGDGPEDFVCIVGPYLHPEVRPGDVGLIIAAPALLDALELFVAQWNACGSNSEFGRYFGNVRDAALAAIAQKEGSK